MHVLPVRPLQIKLRVDKLWSTHTRRETTRLALIFPEVQTQEAGRASHVVVDQGKQAEMPFMKQGLRLLDQKFMH